MTFLTNSYLEARRHLGRHQLRYLNVDSVQRSNERTTSVNLVDDSLQIVGLIVEQTVSLQDDTLHILSLSSRHGAPLGLFSDLSILSVHELEERITIVVQVRGQICVATLLRLVGLRVVRS